MHLKLPKTFDWTLLIIPLILVAAGIAVIYSLTYFNEKIYLMHNQLIYAGIAFLLMVVLTFIDYRAFKAISWWLYLLGIILLVLVLFFGKTSFGATRWIDLGIFQLQPSEFMKLFLIVILAKIISDHYGQLKWKNLIFLLMVALIPMVLIMRQPDFGSFAVLATVTIVIILAAKIKKIHLLTLGLIILMALPTTWFLLKDYQKERLYTFLNPQADQFGAGYNVLQSMITVGNGGLFGQGLGHGQQSQLNFLPVAHTDFIFAGLAEAAGFVGSFFIIIIFIILILRVVHVAQISKDYFGMMVAVGLATMLLFQFFVNVGMNLGIIPVTGIPLPFVSYGGSSLILNFAAIGILQSIYLRHKKISF